MRILDCGFWIAESTHRTTCAVSTVPPVVSGPLSLDQEMGSRPNEGKGPPFSSIFSILTLKIYLLLYPWGEPLAGSLLVGRPILSCSAPYPDRHPVVKPAHLL